MNGLGATGSLGGQAVFNIDPNTLVGASDIKFQVSSAAVGAGVISIMWYQNGTFIGVGSFYGAGIQLGSPGVGLGSFS